MSCEWAGYSVDSRCSPCLQTLQRMECQQVAFMPSGAMLGVYDLKMRCMGTRWGRDVLDGMFCLPCSGGDLTVVVCEHSYLAFCCSLWREHRCNTMMLWAFLRVSSPSICKTVAYLIGHGGDGAWSKSEVHVLSLKRIGAVGPLIGCGMAGSYRCHASFV
jgi:hypothetical protein